MWNKWWEKNIKVETGLCTLCPLHELLTHTRTQKHAHTASVNHLHLPFWEWKSVDVWHAAENRSHPIIIYPYQAGLTFPCELIILGIASAAQIQPPYHPKTSFCWNPAYRDILRRILSDAKKTLSHTSQPILSSRCVCTQWEALSQTFILLHPRACSPWPAGW